jgi:hypothetical protein
VIRSFGCPEIVDVRTVTVGVGMREVVADAKTHPARLTFAFTINLTPRQDLVVSWGESSRLNRLRQDDHRSEHGHDDARTHA